VPKYLQALIIAGVLLFLSAAAFIIFKLNEMSDRQKNIEDQVTKQKELVDGIVRSQTEYATKKDLEKFITGNGVNYDVIKNDLDKLQADIIAANFVTFQSMGQVLLNASSTGKGKPNPNYTPPPPCKDGVCPDIDVHGYFKQQEKKDIYEKFNNFLIPLADLGFSAWEKDPWEIKIYPRQYKLGTVIGKDENEKTYVYNRMTITVNDKEYEIPVKSETKQQYPEAKWSFWNPRLFLGVDGGVAVNPVQGEFAPSLNLGIMSYGRYLSTPDFSVLQIGGGYGIVSQTFQFNITPFAYNVGQHIPFMKNFYLGPSVHVGTDGNVKIMAGVRVGL
jgi:hypothetical protein